MAPHTFKSLMRPDQRAFEAVDSGALWDSCYRTPGVLTYHAAFYETYGDGTVKHCGSSPISATENGDLAADWMASLAASMVELKTIPEAVGSLAFEMRPIDRATVELLAGVKPSDKPRWISIREKKISSAESRQFDKRWTALPLPGLTSDMDIFSFMFGCGRDSGSPTYRLSTMLSQIAAWEIICSVTNRSCEYCEWLEKTFKCSQDYRLMLDSFQLLNRTIECLEGLWGANRSVDCWTSNYGYKPEAVAA